MWKINECLEEHYVCEDILYQNYSYDNRCNCPDYIEDKINVVNNIENKSKLTINVKGDPDSEHTTIVYNNDNNGIIFYYDGHEGTSYNSICKLLDIVGVEYFTVIKRG